MNFENSLQFLKQIETFFLTPHRELTRQRAYQGKVKYIFHHFRFLKILRQNSPDILTSLHLYIYYLLYNIDIPAVERPRIVCLFYNKVNNMITAIIRSVFLKSERFLFFVNFRETQHHALVLKLCSQLELRKSQKMFQADI